MSEMAATFAAASTFFGINAISVELYIGSAYQKRYRYIDGNGTNAPAGLLPNKSMISYTFTNQPPALNGATTLLTQGYFNYINVLKTDVKAGSFVVFVCQVVTVHQAGDFKGEMAFNLNNFDTSSTSVTNETSAAAFLKTLGVSADQFEVGFHPEDFTSSDATNIFVGDTNTLSEGDASNYAYMTFSFPMKEGAHGDANVAMIVNVSNG